MLNLSSIMIGTMNLSEMVDFYQKVFDRAPEMQDDTYSGWLVGNTFFTVGKHTEMNGATKDPGRVMLNFDTKEVQKEFDRIKALGAKVIKEPYQIENAWIATLADPDGNYFQLMTPWEGYKSS